MTGELNNAEEMLSVDREGRLVAAGPRLLDLQRAAGGSLGGELAVPPLAALARLARSLGAPVSRTITVADGGLDVSLSVSARLNGDVIELAVSGWKERRAAAPLQATHAMGAAFNELENDGDWSCDPRLILTAAPKPWADISGDVHPGTKLQTVLQFLESENGDLPLLDALAGRTPFEGQLAQIRSNKRVQMTLFGAPLTDATGQFAGFRGGFRFADRVRAVQSRSRPPADIRADSQFAKRLDAALRRPLSRIVSDADAIAGRSDGALRQDYAVYAGDISAAARHLLSLVDDLVDMQAIEQPGFSIELEPVDLADIARRASGLLGVRANDRGVKIDAPASDEALPATGDFGRTLQILVNLIGNAVRYSPAGSMVWVRTEQEGDLAAVIVADQGKGISPENHARIFEKFQRVDPDEPGGSGLGLFISRKLARAMGGDITVDSAPGQGARFVLTLPQTD